MKAVGLAAVAAAVVAAALVASRNTGTGDGAAAAAVGAEPASQAIADTASDRAGLEAVPIAPPPPSAVPPQAFPIGEPRTTAAPKALTPPSVKVAVRQAVTSAMPAAAASMGPRAAARPTTPSVDAVPDVASVASAVPKPGGAELSADEEFGGRR